MLLAGLIPHPCQGFEDLIKLLVGLGLGWQGKGLAQPRSDEVVDRGAGLSILDVTLRGQVMGVGQGSSFTQHLCWAASERSRLPCQRACGGAAGVPMC